MNDVKVVMTHCCIAPEKRALADEWFAWQNREDVHAYFSKTAKASALGLERMYRITTDTSDDLFVFQVKSAQSLAPDLSNSFVQQNIEYLQQVCPRESCEILTPIIEYDGNGFMAALAEYFAKER